jgi:hypothetical protein
LSKVVDVVDPKRLLESALDGPSPNVLVQNLLGVARTEAAPDGARRRAKRSIDGVFASPPKVEAPSEPVARSATARPPAVKATAARSAAPLPSSMPPKSMPAAVERRPGSCGEPCGGCTPFGGL